MTISIDTVQFNDTAVQVEYSWSKYYPATFHAPEEGGFEELLKVWAELRDSEGKTHLVDILPVLSGDDYETLVGAIMCGIED